MLLTPVRQSGGTLQLQDDGTYKAVETFAIAWSRVQVSMPVRNVTPHPDFSTMLCSGCEVRRQKSGTWALMAITYTGVFPGIAGGTPVIEELVAGTTESPIDTHPKFVTKIGGTKGSAVAKTNKAVFHDAGAFQAFQADSPFAGVTSYLSPTISYRRTTFSGAGLAVPSDLGKISAPSIAAPSGRNWLRAGRTVHTEGGVTSVVDEWILSGPAGFNQIIYGNS